MSISRKALLSLIITGALFVGFMVGLNYFKQAQQALAGVTIGNEQQATTTDATWSTAVGRCKDTLTSNTVLGSIIVTKTSNAVLYVYDATTTSSHSHHATTTIASFPLTTVGAYPFDVKLKRGLCVVVDTTVGVASTTIIHRP